MFANPLNEIWAAICDECKKTISEVSFNCFFKDLVPVRITDGEFTLSIDDYYKRGMVENLYSEKIDTAIKTVMGLELKCRIVLEEDEEKILKAEQQSEGLSFEDFFTFQNFIVGATNRFAHAAALAVAEAQFPQPTFNPLVIYGPSGVGKTHLMLAIKNHVKKKYPQKVVKFVRGEEFTNKFIEALNQGKLGLPLIEEFRSEYRNVDVLLIDDIHFIAGKESTQEEFFNTFNALYQNNKQIVVTLDRPVKEIKTLDDRIRSRFEGGFYGDITPPDFETRVGILNKKAEQVGIELEDSLIYYIAEHIKSNTRQLEGVIKRLHAYITIQNKTPNISIVQSTIRDVISDDKPEPIKVENIITEVARTYNVSDAEILSNRKTANLVLARQVAMYIARQTTDLSYKAIGESFGKDHTTVLYNVNRIEEFLKDKPYQKELVEDIIKNLRNNASGSY